MNDKNPLNIIKVIRYRRKNKVKDQYQWNGLEVYLGGQGKGKTISAVRTLKNRLQQYPKAILFTNTEIKGIKNNTYFFRNSEELVELLKNNIVENNRVGYVIFIDEIHVVLAELFGRTDPIFLMFLSQQRKLNINIIGTSQMYNKNPRIIRDYLRQSGQIIICHNFLKLLQWNLILNMENVEEDSKNNLTYQGARLEWFFHNIELYESYDTFATISQIKGLLKGNLRNLNSLGEERKEENGECNA